MHQSVATIASPEFINLTPLDINPLMSKCEIKVLYIGENRNYSFISKEVATEMSKTLRGAPIVGYYKESKEDFADHGEQLIIDDEGIKFNCLTKPYGFVSPDAEVWFQKFEDTDDFGNKIEREYLMTTGYLWTGQFEECKVVVEEGRPHSMEIDSETMQGHWSTDVKSGMDFFIINDAIFSKLCILGDDVEPCFEGSSVTAPEVSTSFTKVDDNFKKTLYNMMQDLRFVLEGGQNMDKVVNASVEQKEISTSQDNFSLENQTENQVSTEDTTFAAEENAVENVAPESAEPSTSAEFAKEDDKKEDNQADSKEDKEESDSKDSEDEENKKDDDKKKYELLQTQYDELNAKFTTMKADYQALKDFKANIEDKEKDALIARFYMLSDEDKKDVIANKSNYSLEDIEAKLSVIYTKQSIAAEQKKSEASSEETQAVVTTFNLNNSDSSNVPDWIKAVREVQENLN